MLDAATTLKEKGQGFVSAGGCCITRRPPLFLLPCSSRVLLLSLWHWCPLHLTAFKPWRVAQHGAEVFALEGRAS